MVTGKRRKLRAASHGRRTADSGRPPIAAQSALSAPSAEFVPRIDTELAGVRFENPALTASGTFGYGKEFAHLIDLNQLGGIVVKGISVEPMEATRRRASTRPNREC